MQNMEKKIQEEETSKNREKNLVMQRDNKLKVLEDKVKQLTQENEVLKKSQGKPKTSNIRKDSKEEVKDKVVKFKDADKILNEKIEKNEKQKEIIPGKKPEI